MTCGGILALLTAAAATLGLPIAVGRVIDADGAEVPFSHAEGEVLRLLADHPEAKVALIWNEVSVAVSAMLSSVPVITNGSP